MVRMPWFSMYAEDWITSPSLVRMNCTQEGAYIRLLCYAWIDKTCSLPRNTVELKKMARWTGRQKGFEAVEQCLCIHPDDPLRYTNKRLLEEWNKATARSKTKQKAALDRWHKPPPVPASTHRVQDRESKGFSPFKDTLASVADKHFPPI